jgi:aryl-alcohol dehydrogenase-like predicted oxidoreductase
LEPLQRPKKQGRKHASVPNFKLDRVGYSPENISRAVEESLIRLQTDYVDILYVHSSEKMDDVHECAKVFSQLIQIGKIREVGVSNFNLNQIKNFSNQLHLAGGAKLFAVQNHYNLIERDSKILPFDEYSHRTNFGMATEILPYLIEQSIYNFSYHSLCRGVLTDFSVRNMSVKVDSLHAKRTQKYFTKEVKKFLESILEISTSLNVTVSSLALSWLRQEYRYTIPVLSCNSIEQLKESARTILLSDDHFSHLDILKFEELNRTK